MCVCGKVIHRKWLGGVSSFFRMQLRHLEELSASQRALVHFQSCGEQFTNDDKKYFGDVSAWCPNCEIDIDSRMHRFEDCRFFQPVRRESPGLMRLWRSLLIQAKAYSLWPEPLWYEDFIGLLHAIPFPRIVKVECLDHHIVFTDGSCKFQKFPEIRISSSSAVEAFPNGDSSLVWSGLVPHQQSIYRGEILAGVTAVMRFKKVTIYTDNLAFLRTARKIFVCHRRKQPVHLPEEERDLWSLFALSLDDDSSVDIHKTKAHVKWEKSNDLRVRWEGYYNDLADCAAKQVLSLFSKEFPFYDELCKSFLKQLNSAKQMALFHARIGEFGTTRHFTDSDLNIPQVIGNVEGPVQFLPQAIDHPDPKSGLSIRFVTILCEWLSGLEWFHHTVDGQEDMSWIELFGAFLLTCKTFPPIPTREGDQIMDDHEDVILHSHTFAQGLKTWRRYIAFIQKQCPMILPPKTPISRSVARWNRKGAGLVGRIPLSLEIRSTLHQWLSLQKKNLPAPFVENYFIHGSLR